MKKIIVVLSILIVAVTLLSFGVYADDPEAVVYVSDSGKNSNDGASADTPIASLTTAYQKVANGGTIVICGDKVVSTNFNTPITSGTVTITSNYGGVDYRQAGAELIFKYNMYLNGDTVFKDINIVVGASNKAIGCNSNKVVFDTGIVCTQAEDVTTYLSIVGGSFDGSSTRGDDTLPTNITVNSGTWYTFRGANRASATSKTNGDVNITINGGTFNGRFAAGGNPGVNGNINLTVNGGTFNSYVSASCINNEAKGAVSGNVTFTINGGLFKGKVMLCDDFGDKVSGTGTMTITGGEFGEDATILGNFCAQGSTLIYGDYAEASAIASKISGFTTVVDTPTDPGDDNTGTGDNDQDNNDQDNNDQNNNDQNNNNEQIPDNPDTSDLSFVVVIVMIISGISALAFLKSKKPSLTK